MRTSGTGLSAESGARASEGEEAFHDAFVSLFNAHFQRLFRYLDRSSGDAELAQDLAQETFLRLYKRGALPDTPEPWLISVAMNLLRNAKTKQTRRARLLTRGRAARAHSDSRPSPSEGADAEQERRHVRAALDGLTERDASLLLLRAEGYAYRDLSEALGIAEGSVGTLLARAKARFRKLYQEVSHAR